MVCESRREAQDNQAAVKEAEGDGTPPGSDEGGREVN